MISCPIRFARILLVAPAAKAQWIESLLKCEGAWDCLGPFSIAEAMQHLRSGMDPDALLLVPEPDTAEYLALAREIKFGHAPGRISVIFLLSAELDDCRAQAYQAGANDVIQLPVSRDELTLRLLNTVHTKRATDSLENATVVITSLAKAIEGRDAYTCGHVERVATYAIEIGKRVGLGEDELAALQTGALVHDIGKIIIPDHVLNKPGPLTGEEMANMKRHPVIGHQILQPLHTFQKVLPIVRWHHERPNGHGYPDGLSGEALPLLPRIASVADFFDAISTDRPYRPALPLETCQKLLWDAAEKGDLDAELVRVLFDIIGAHVLVHAVSAGAKDS